MAKRYWLLGALFSGILVHCTGGFFAAVAPRIPTTSTGQVWLVPNIAKHAHGLLHYDTLTRAIAIWTLQVVGIVIVIWAAVILQREIDKAKVTAKNGAK